MSLASNIHELLLGGGSTYSYTINNSLRLRSSASAYLSRTPASAGNRKTWTWSGWVKRGSLSNYNTIFSIGSGVLTSPYGGLRFNDSTNTFEIYDATSNTGSTIIDWTSTPVYRDVSAWYHLVAVLDTTQSTSSNRFKLYINGVLQTGSFGTTPTQNADCQFNSSSTHAIGAFAGNYGSTSYYDGYLAEVNFIDGLALDPSYFGATNTTTGTWAPKAYSGSYGTNGFYLPFRDTSGTTSGSNTGLGKDFSGNGNYWNTNNISLTAGSTYDAMLDSPTPNSSTVGNYAVLNPIGVLVDSSTISISNGNLTFNASGGSIGRAVSTIAMPSGKWYAEFSFSSYTAASDDQGFGVINAASAQNALGQSLSSIVYIGRTGEIRVNDVYSSYGSTYGVGDIIGVAFDADTNKIWFAKNGTWQASGNPAAGTNPATTLTSVTNSCFGVNYNSLSATFAANANFGQRPFSYTPPTGFKGLQTYNLPTPTINKGNQYFDTTLYTGTGATQSITNSGFQPDFVWAKARSTGFNHGLFDSVRGTNNALRSNLTSAETNEVNTLTAFNSTGFTVGADATGLINYNGTTYVGWQWKGGGTAVTNTNGSITSQVSANPTAGFSVVTYTGTGANATVGHGLGVAPSMIIVKNRTTAGEWWHVYLKALGATQALFLNSTNAAGTSSDWWNNTSPTSSVFTVNISGAVNGNSASLVAYCFAAIPGYSAFGSYTGSGTSDPTFVYTGFRPAFILRKRSDASADWYIQDSKRPGDNRPGNNGGQPGNDGRNWHLSPNTSSVESDTFFGIDILSNGFKVRTNEGSHNSGTIIYAAFAENPFKYSLAR